MNKVYAIRQSVSFGDDVSVVPPHDVVFSSLEKARDELYQRVNEVILHRRRLSESGEPPRHHWSECKTRCAISYDDILMVFRIAECLVV